MCDANSPFLSDNFTLLLEDMMVTAVIFDVDGTLVDSVDLHAAAWAMTFKKYGKQVDVKDVRRQIGKGSDQLLPVFFSKEAGITQESKSAIACWCYGQHQH